MAKSEAQKSSAHPYLKPVHTEVAFMGHRPFLCITWPLPGDSVRHSIRLGCTSTNTHLSSDRAPFPAPHDMCLASAMPSAGQQLSFPVRMIP